MSIADEVQRSQAVASAAVAEVLTYLKETATPSSEEAHRIIDSILTKHNFTSPEGHIVASGTQSAEPHEFGSGLIKENVPIVIDIYPRSNETGYYGDITRTVCLGEAPPELQRMHDTVLGAMEVAFALVRPGQSCKGIHQTVMDYFVQHGYETSGKGREFTYAEGFVHATGHGVGKRVHQAPTIGPNSGEVLKVGDIITIEPGLYYKHIGGVRIEDIIEVTEDGYRNLTSTLKELVI